MSTGGFSFKVDGWDIEIPWRTILSALVLLGIGGAGVSAGGGLIVSNNATTDVQHVEILEEVQSVDAKVDTLTGNSAQIRTDVNDIGRTQDELVDGLGRVRERDRERDRILGLEDQLKDFPLDKPKPWRQPVVKPSR